MVGGDYALDEGKYTDSNVSGTLKLLGFDLGAESGRAVIGNFDGEKLSLKEAHRFPNEPVRLCNGFHWDILRLIHEIKKGLGICIHEHSRDIAGMGVDTWGVDFVLLGRGDELLGNPFHYRDNRTDSILEEAFGRVPREAIFKRTGNQFMKFNTIFQLLATKLQSPWLLKEASHLLMIPDYLNFILCGNKISEFTIASTTQAYDPCKKEWAWSLLEEFELPPEIFPDVVEPGTVIGKLIPSIAKELGCKEIPVIAPAEHDTGSAVAAVPAFGGEHAYISSGTWSLMGIEVMEPLITRDTLEYNFTNEGGVCGTFRLLKNIMGLWLVQECRRTWAREGESLSYNELTSMAEKAPPFLSLINPDDEAFLNPEKMPEEIVKFCSRTNQHIPSNKGEIVRCILESLALRYRWTLEKLEEISGKKLTTIHIVGGGTRNRLLSQLTANVTRRPVLTGPVEATILGNILTQAMALGELTSLDDMRQVVRASFPLELYEPQGFREVWDELYAKFIKLIEE